ncbi:centriole and centriolar satellite protein OFD1-like [Bolinopsis microptera]|uniref:centriole and centriolar satellite protein OFD1-like n=1 Tax=Bolinopsis microptera TaxID=2820187 RepID=UPI00307A23BD
MGESLSEDEFRKALYESLSKKGIVSSFKSHLRQQIALQLSLKGTEKESTQAALVGDMITAAHLKHSHYDYSLSTFLSEANISDKGLNYEEWLRLLNVSDDSSLARALTASNKATTSPLLSFLEAVVKSCGQGVESAAIQTEAVTLQDKLNMLDEKYADLPADHFLSEQDKQLQKINMENKQIQDIVKLEVERFKELELERYKLLERDRVNKDFNKKLSDYETEYRQRLDGLHKREVESTRALDKLKADTEAGLFKERQLLLSELETLRSRSSQLEREHALTKNQVCLDQEKLGILQARLEERGTNLKEKEEDFRNKLQEHKEKARLQCKGELREREEKIAAKESQLQEEQEDHMRTRTGLDTHVEEVKKLRTDNANIQDNIVLLEAQLDTARSQALHYEAKLTVTADYEQIKNSLISMEAERKQLLESFDKERRLSQQSETQLQEIIYSLREQLSRPSQTESDAVNELTKLKHRHYNQVNELKNQVNKIQSELEREQKSRLSAQTELRDQFLECRAHHAVSSQPKPTSTEMPDFLKKYLSSVRLGDDADADEDISEQSTKLLSDVSVSSDSILRPTRSIVAGSRKLFDQLEEEEQALEREFVSFRNSNMTDIARMAISGTVPEPAENFNIQHNVPPQNRSYLPAARKPEKPKLIESAGPARVSEPAPTHHVLSEEENPSQSTITPSASVETITPSAGVGTVTPGVGTVTPGDGQKTDIMENLDPVMQQYLNRVLQNKEENKAGKSGQPSAVRQDDSEHIEQVEFDKTDSDFSW